MAGPEKNSAEEPAARERSSPTEGTANAADGTALYTLHWAPDGKPWATVLIVHGIAEHSGRYERTGRLLAQSGLDVHSFDLRGHGKSEGERVFVRRWDDYLDDVAARMAAIREPGRPFVLMGHSMGALISLTYACSGRPSPDLLVLSALTLDALVPAWQRILAPVLSRVAPHVVLANPIDGAHLSRDPAVGEAYFADPLVQHGTTTRLGAEFFRAMKRGRSQLDSLHVPALVIHGGDDVLVPTPVSEPVADVPGVERRVLEHLRHESLNEPEGPRVVADIVAWLRDQVAAMGASVVFATPAAPAWEG
jgi:acylglycerol lipase